ncbi:hypothetical protein BX283_7453 [Streptomyces sp. TLI_146]|nr:hypothetical protein BX283_7453 [Streptomyces sp. TLI_146]
MGDHADQTPPAPQPHRDRADDQPYPASGTKTRRTKRRETEVLARLPESPLQPQPHDGHGRCRPHPGASTLQTLSDQNSPPGGMHIRCIDCTEPATHRGRCKSHHTTYEGRASIRTRRARSRRRANRRDAAARLRRRVQERGSAWCDWCTGTFPPDGVDVYHMRPLSLGGEDVDNVQVLCRGCHGLKTVTGVRGRRLSLRRAPAFSGDLPTRPRGRHSRVHRPEVARTGDGGTLPRVAQARSRCGRRPCTPAVPRRLGRGQQRAGAVHGLKASTEFGGAAVSC